MAKIYRGDTFPFTVSFEDYTFKTGDVITASFMSKGEEDNAEHTILKTIEYIVQNECEKVQLEFSREDMYDISGNVVLEARVITSTGIEMTVQKEYSIGKDGIR